MTARGYLLQCGNSPEVVGEFLGGVEVDRRCCVQVFVGVVVWE